MHQSSGNTHWTQRLKNLLNIITVVIISASIYSIWQAERIILRNDQQQTQRLKEFAKLLDQNGLQLQALTLSQQQQQTKVQSALHQLDQQIQLAQNPIHDLSTEWLILKAHYALELAQMNAYWGTDRASTLGLLEQADRFLAQSQDPSLSPVRQALAEDITEQRSAPVLDQIGLLSQLDAIQQLVMKHSFDRYPTPLSPALQTKPGPATTWRKRLQADLNNLQHFFVIRYRNDPLEPLLTPAYKSMQRESIRISLQTAQWAVLQRNNGVYHFALQQTVQQVPAIFGQNSQETQTILGLMTPLQAVSLEFKAVIPQHSLVSLNQLTRSNSAVNQRSTP